jgi:hypothetical protein
VLINLCVYCINVLVKMELCFACNVNPRHIVWLFILFVPPEFWPSGTDVCTNGCVAYPRTQQTWFSPLWEWHACDMTGVKQVSQWEYSERYLNRQYFSLLSNSFFRFLSLRTKTCTIKSCIHSTTRFFLEQDFHGSWLLSTNSYEYIFSEMETREGGGGGEKTFVGPGRVGFT